MAAQFRCTADRIIEDQSGQKLCKCTSPLLIVSIRIIVLITWKLVPESRLGFNDTLSDDCVPNDGNAILANTCCILMQVLGTEGDGISTTMLDLSTRAVRAGFAGQGCGATRCQLIWS